MPIVTKWDDLPYNNGYIHGKNSQKLGYDPHRGIPSRLVEGSLWFHLSHFWERQSICTKKVCVFWVRWRFLALSGHMFILIYTAVYFGMCIYIHKQVNMDILNTRICIQIHIHIVGHCTKIPATTYLNLFDTSLTCGVA